MKHLALITFILAISSGISISQSLNPIIVKAQVIDGDTIPSIELSEIEIYSLIIPPSRKQQKKLTRLIKNVKKVYPWARLAGIQLRKYEKELINAKNERERKKIFGLSMMKILLQNY